MSLSQIKHTKPNKVDNESLLKKQVLGSIGQCLDLVSQISDEAFCYKDSYHSSIGAHIRHIIDRINCFVSGVSSTLIDYDARERNPSIESCAKAAQQELNKVKKYFTESFAEPTERMVLVKETVSIDCEPLIVTTTIGRELTYLIDHNTHHLAVIKLIYEKLGGKIADNVGKAASTIIYERKLAEGACAQ